MINEIGFSSIISFHTWSYLTHTTDSYPVTLRHSQRRPTSRKWGELQSRVDDYDDLCDDAFFELEDARIAKWMSVGENTGFHTRESSLGAIHNPYAEKLRILISRAKCRRKWICRVFCPETLYWSHLQNISKGESCCSEIAPSVLQSFASNIPRWAVQSSALVQQGSA